MIIAVANRKGGTGKTTHSAHIGAGLASKGYRVGIVDTDSQGHIALAFGQGEKDALYELLVAKAPIEQCVIEVPADKYAVKPDECTGALYLLPSSTKTYRIPGELGEGDIFAFLDAVELFRDTYTLDLVLIDTAPTMSVFDGAVFLAADGFIYVTECERLSLDGVMVAYEQMRRFATARKKRLGKESRVVGIIPNKCRGTIVHGHNVSALKEQFGDLVWPTVTLRTMWTEASNLATPVYLYAPKDAATADAWTIIERAERAIWVADAPR